MLMLPRQPHRANIGFARRVVQWPIQASSPSSLSGENLVMRKPDGIGADVYRPDAPGKFRVLVMRTLTCRT
jgi:hypothetical protein